MQKLNNIFPSVAQITNLCLHSIILLIQSIIQPFINSIFQLIHKIFHFIKLCLSDNQNNISSTRVAMLIIVLWFLADWLMEFHSKGIYTLTWEKLTLLTSVFGLKAIQKFPESSGNNSQNNNSQSDQIP